MAYGLSTRMFIEDGAAEHAAKIDSGHLTARTWHALNAACRLELIEQALRAVNHVFDEFPNAL